VEKVLEDTTLQEWDDVLDLNVRSIFLMCKEAAEHLKDGGGRVINIASVLGHIGMREDLAYVTSKHAVVGFTRALALDWARKGVRVNAIGPGYFETEMIARAVADEPSAKYMRRDTPLGRWGQPEELVGATIFLASQASDFMTGQLVLVDGGKSAK
jgi:NAD(P)-dependent dehydrogenase (short-subunit alcohol dehydrogenase family)